MKDSGDHLIPINPAPLEFAHPKDCTKRGWVNHAALAGKRAHGLSYNENTARACVQLMKSLFEEKSGSEVRLTPSFLNPASSPVVGI